MGNVPSDKTNATATIDDRISAHIEGSRERERERERECNRGAKPEDIYAGTADSAIRRRIQSDVVEAYRARVAAYVRRNLAPRHRQEAEQVGLIGLLVALEKFDASRGVPFWFFAVSRIRKEIQTWMNHGVYWRHHPNGVPNRKVREEHMRPASMDGPIKNKTEYTLHDVIIEDVATVEDLVSTAEGVNRVREFVATLNDDDRQLLFYEETNGSNRGKPGSDRFRRYSILVERATAFVRGNDETVRGAGTESDRHCKSVR